MAAFVVSNPAGVVVPSRHAPGGSTCRHRRVAARPAAALRHALAPPPLALCGASSFVGHSTAPAPAPPASSALAACGGVRMDAAASGGAQRAKIILAGAPASGKGTQCEILTAKYGCVHLSTGDMLRAAVKAGTPLGKSAAVAMDAGALVPDEVVIGMIVERLAADDVADRGWLLDGFPRTGAQAAALDAAGVVPDAVLTLDVGVDTLVRRVTGRRSDPETGKVYHLEFAPPPNKEVAARLVRRSDDTEEKVRVRVAAFEEHAAAIGSQYPEMVRVDGERDVDVVAADIHGVIDTALGDAEATGAGGDAAAAPQGGGAGTPKSAKGMSVNEFVRYAEEAYDSGVLTNDKVNW